jgi:hypothetical protein
MFRLAISPQLLRSEAELDALHHDFANPAHYEYPIEENAIVIGPDGRVIARLVTGCLDADLVRKTVEHFRTVHGDASNRGGVVGPGAMMNRVRTSDGTLGFTKEVPRSIIQRMQEANTFTDFLGWFDKSPTGDRFSYCRETAWSLENPEVLEAARPFVAEVDRVYREELPDHWRQQREFMDRVSADFKFNDSVFSTVTVNRNLRATYHYDDNDYRGGMGNLVVLEGGDGGALVMPKFRVAFAPQPTDVLLMNVHEMHGNLAFVGERLTAVLYAREHIDECEDAYKAIDDDLPSDLFTQSEEGGS